MSHKLPSEEQQELSWEEAVARYLEDNPDYFERHASILDKLVIPHAQSGGTISLIERQVQVLRDKNQDVSRQLQELIAIARENDNIGERLHDFAIAMIDSNTLDDTLDAAHELLQQKFNLEQVVIRFRPTGELKDTRPEFSTSDNETLDRILQQLSNNKGKPGKPVCGIEQDAQTLSCLFADQAERVKSYAMVALGDGHIQGVLALGSQRAKRFQPKMGTLYLHKIGELLYRAVARHLS